MSRKTLFIVSAVLILLACKSNEDQYLFESSNLPGMIYDSDNRPCERVLINAYRIGESGEEFLFSVETDINGRFTLPGLDRGAYKIEAVKRGYERLSTQIEYTSRTEVLYLKMFSQEQILGLAAEYLEMGQKGKCREALDRSSLINDRNPHHLYTEAIFQYRSGDYEKALTFLEMIEEQGFRFPAVFLFKGDIYQYQYLDFNKAKEALQEYLLLIDDGDVKMRIEELEQE
ncbi:carboxypeptidase-like regulatory domain-containing protein [Spirochaeta isovalerica]|uniref:Tetratricopeptide (TPR) repeat protein n=1 Tax=Spirochaeta isovalerica TaxID=150 RepID=A0A841R610_9SPIO|nr:carboxypeptidase-like regulatory domain-containing protein [Spirochaeta isovalerica]MBB6478490.1 tetratricopeptide (TPR) repeat protein [Spirochaeta isovalerica]